MYNNNKKYMIKCFFQESISWAVLFYKSNLNEIFCFTKKHLFVLQINFVPIGEKHHK